MIRRTIIAHIFLLVPAIIYSQETFSYNKKKDTVINEGNTKLTLPTLLVKNNFDYKKVLQQIKEDSSFYKAFRNLRILNYTSYNDIKMLNKEGSIKASLFSKTEQQAIFVTVSITIITSLQNCMLLYSLPKALFAAKRIL
jgi:hypothetical protein